MSEAIRDRAVQAAYAYMVPDGRWENVRAPEYFYAIVDAVLSVLPQAERSREREETIEECAIVADNCERPGIAQMIRALKHTQEGEDG